MLNEDNSWSADHGDPWMVLIHESISWRGADSSSCFGLMLKLKLQYLGYLIKRADSLDMRPWCWERLKTREEGDDREWDGWLASPTQWPWVWANLWELVKNREAWSAAVHGVAKGRTWLSNWTTTDSSLCFSVFLNIFWARTHSLIVHFPSVKMETWRMDAYAIFSFSNSPGSKFFKEILRAFVDQE